MAAKFPLTIVEEALASYLDGISALNTHKVFKGLAKDDLELPSVIVTANNAVTPPDAPVQGLGNYQVTATIGVFDNIDDTLDNTQHRTALQEVMAALDNVPGVQASFTSKGDATCYDCAFESVDEGRGDRCWASSFTYRVTICLSPV
jgi:hypothetical protein